MSLINNITLLEIDKIFPNTNIKRRYLSILSEATGIVFDNIRTINAVNNAIIDSWNYELSKVFLTTCLKFSIKSSSVFEFDKSSSFSLNFIISQYGG